MSDCGGVLLFSLRFLYCPPPSLLFFFFLLRWTRVKLGRESRLKKTKRRAALRFSFFFIATCTHETCYPLAPRPAPPPPPSARRTSAQSHSTTRAENDAGCLKTTAKMTENHNNTKAAKAPLSLLEFRERESSFFCLFCFLALFRSFQRWAFVALLLLGRRRNRKRKYCFLKRRL
jgi:hypothetical protein